MKQEIRDIIKKNLPSEVGDVLRERLTELETTEKAHKILVRSYDGIEQKYIKASKEIEKLTSQIITQEELAGREKTLEQEQNKMTVTIAELKLDGAYAQVNQMQGILGQVFASPVYRQTHTKEKILENRYNSNNGQYEDVVTGETETTETREE